MVLNPAGQALLRSVQGALSLLDDGVQAAASAARRRIAAFARDRAAIVRQPLAVAAHGAAGASSIRRCRSKSTRRSELIDLQREGFHAAVRQGKGPWPGTRVGAAVRAAADHRRWVRQPAARRLRGAQPEAIAREPLLGDSDLWKDWFAAAGLRINVRTVAAFNDAGLMLQAAEQNLGLALARELLAADALCEGRLVQLSPIAIMHPEALPYHLVYPPNLRDWPPLMAFRSWLFDQLDCSLKALRARITDDAQEPRPKAPPKGRRTSRR